MVGHTDYGLYSLLHLLQLIEKAVSGRYKKSWAPREIDIDVLLYGYVQISNKIISVPHHELMNRPFLVKLLAEIAPDLIYPVYNESFKEIAEKI
jgi:2-amino-4-hydroxy-6-hydroxymethyldihydropteridine diphosphokinase